MAMKTFWQDKWLNDQYSQRNPGQANHPDRQRESQTVSVKSPQGTPTRPKGAPTRGGKKK